MNWVAKYLRDISYYPGSIHNPGIGCRIVDSLGDISSVLETYHFVNYVNVKVWLIILNYFVEMGLAKEG
ncbi:hypothetical protein L3N51_02451 [Metallosphaera sp. J1]|nr:hypothetical protein [Metallosphaera javensis (ex Hofmann et al. 2022)]